MLADPHECIPAFRSDVATRNSFLIFSACLENRNEINDPSQTSERAITIAHQRQLLYASTLINWKFNWKKNRNKKSKHRQQMSQCSRPGSQWVSEWVSAQVYLFGYCLSPSFCSFQITKRNQHNERANECTNAINVKWQPLCKLNALLCVSIIAMSNVARQINDHRSVTMPFVSVCECVNPFDRFSPL